MYIACSRDVICHPRPPLFFPSLPLWFYLLLSLIVRFPSLCCMQRAPKISAHFEKLGVHADPLVCKWFLCLFINCMPLECTLRFLDSYLLEGYKILLRVTLTLFKLAEKSFLACTSFEQAYVLVTSLPSKAPAAHVLFQHAFDRLFVGSLPGARINRLKDVHMVRPLRFLHAYYIIIYYYHYYFFIIIIIIIICFCLLVNVFSFILRVYLHTDICHLIFFLLCWFCCQCGFVWCGENDTFVCVVWVPICHSFTPHQTALVEEKRHVIEQATLRRDQRRMEHERLLAAAGVSTVHVTAPPTSLSGSAAIAHSAPNLLPNGPTHVNTGRSASFAFTTSTSKSLTGSGGNIAAGTHISSVAFSGATSANTSPVLTPNQLHMPLPTPTRAPPTLPPAIDHTINDNITIERGTSPRPNFPRTSVSPRVQRHDARTPNLSPQRQTATNGSNSPTPSSPSYVPACATNTWSCSHTPTITAATPSDAVMLTQIGASYRARLRPLSFLIQPVEVSDDHLLLSPRASPPGASMDSSIITASSTERPRLSSIIDQSE